MKRIQFLFIPLIIWSCGSAVVINRDGQQGSKPANCKLDVYNSVASISRPYEITCQINAKSGGTTFSDRTIDGAIKKAMPLACSCGADAVVVVDDDQKGIHPFSWGKTVARINAIRYLD